MSERDDCLPDQLDAHERETLATVVSLIIPPSEDGRLPGAGELDVAAYLAGPGRADLPRIREHLAILERRARECHERAFSSLGEPEAEEVLASLRAVEPGFLEALARHTVCCYYQDDRVLAAIGLEPRPPYPLGFEVVPGDLSALEPVRRRGRIYRESE